MKTTEIKLRIGTNILQPKEIQSFSIQFGRASVVYKVAIDGLNNASMTVRIDCDANDVEVLTN